MTDPIKLDRKPYTISYVDQDGQQKTIRRIPPPKLHDAMPTDKVELKRKLSDDFLAGDELTVKAINPRHPNTLKVENPEGKITFISSYDMLLKDKLAARDGVPVEQLPERNKYLLWP